MQNEQIFNATTEDRFIVIATHYTGETMDGCAMFDCVIFDTHEGDVYVQENCMCMDCALLQTRRRCGMHYVIKIIKNRLH